jgi:hypothetical protein
MLNDFKQNFKGGARLNRFFVTGSIPFSGQSVSKFHIRASAIPQLQTQTLSYDYRGRKSHYPGEKQYPVWSITVLDDTAPGDLWTGFQKWQNALNNHDTNSVNNSVLNHQTQTFKSTWTINHMNLNGDEDTPLKKITLFGCWPKAINPINFNMNRPNALNVFDVVMVYDYINIQNVT